MNTDEAEKTMLENSASDRMAKLPKWAQEYIENLKRVIGQRDAEIRALSSSHPGSNVVLDQMSDMPETTLPPNSNVVFYMEPYQPGSPRFLRDSIEVHHHADAYGAQLVVRAPNGGLEVVPRANNSIYLRTKR